MTWASKQVRRGLRLDTTAVALAVALASGSVMAQDFTIDGGGEVLSETVDQQWQLSGSIGQPDATELIDLAGNGWTLTGGFWGVNIDQTNLLFRDEFESETTPTR